MSTSPISSQNDPIQNRVRELPVENLPVVDRSVLQQARWSPETDGVAAPNAAGGTRVDGNATNSGASSVSHTADGKPVISDPLIESGDVAISRERTLVPADEDGQYYVVDDQLVFETGDGNDSINVTQNRNGSLSFNVNGETYEVSPARGQQITIRAGDGDDTIQIDSSVRVNLVIDGGDGNDTINAMGSGGQRISGGDGDDKITVGNGNNYVYGGAGDDTISVLGHGRNVLYGGDGNDTISGGRGIDYIDGGAGDNVLDGVAGQNILVGGSGSNLINTGTGDSRVYAGADSTVINNGGSDVIYAPEAIVDRISAEDGADNTVINVELDPSLGRSLTIQGSEEFVARVQADIDMMRASPYGQQMLAEFDKAAETRGNTVTIIELQNEDNGWASMNPNTSYLTNGRPGRGSDVTIGYNPAFYQNDLPAPSVILYHEMSHAFNAVTGTLMPGPFTGTSTPDDARDTRAGVPNVERQAVGLPSSHPPYDYGNGRVTSSNPFPLTENGMRQEMGLELRPGYALP